MKIYTKTGDKGTTSLFTGKVVSKNNPLIESLGAVDEGNSAIGSALSLFPQSEELQNTRSQLETIQHTLFDVGAAIATPFSQASEKKLEKTRFDQEGISLLENWIDNMEAQIPPLTHFILPGGHPAGAFLHLSRSLIRRAERTILSLYEQKEITQDVLIYLNRLSDYLFVAARLVNHVMQIPETQWTPHKIREL